MVEQLIRNEQVGGSIPFISSIKKPGLKAGLFSYRFIIFLFLQRAALQLLPPFFRCLAAEIRQRDLSLSCSHFYSMKSTVSMLRVPQDII